MIQQLKHVDQTGIKALIKERIENPQRYVNTPLIIWRADIRDGIQERVLREVFDEFNEGRASRCWYKIASVRQMPRTKHDLMWNMLNSQYVDLNDNRPYECVHSAGCGKELIYYNGLFVIDPARASADYCRNHESLKNYLSVINDREWQGIKLADGIPMVAYMCLGDDWFETPEAYPDGEQYVFDPDFEEWAKWAVDKAGLPEIVADFIRSDNDKAKMTYRWYNKFKESDPAPLTGGCRYPANWIREVRVRVPWEAVLTTADTQATEELLNYKFGGQISSDVLAELSRYLTKQNM